MTTIKQFLKPDWRKVVIFVILSIFFNPFVSEDCFVVKCVANQPCHSGCRYSNIIFYQISFFVDWNSVAFFDNLFLFSPLINYLLSCLIVWIYDKLRKRK